MIKSCADKETRAIFDRKRVRHLPPDIHKRAHRKLLTIHAAEALEDTNVPPGNKLHSLDGDRAGQHAIRINDQWRICFRWQDGHAHDVGITDYHE